jgi:hypothetical protein
MRGVIGLVLAAGLGVVGALSNWFYLERLARTEEQEYFIAIADGVTLNVGDTIKKEHLQRVGIPRSGVENLESIAPRWSAVSAIEGLKANRPLKKGDIILEMDRVSENYRSLANTLQEDEAVRWVPIDGSTVVPEHINPGDLVSFDVPRVGVAVPTPSGSTTTPGPGGYVASEIIGPFRVASLGGRRETTPVAGGSRRTGGNESRIAIIVKLANNQLDEQAQRLFEAVRLSGSQGVQVQLHSAKLNVPGR